MQTKIILLNLKFHLKHFYSWPQPLGSHYTERKSTFDVYLVNVFLALL